MKKTLLFICIAFLSLISILAQEGATDITLNSSDVKQFIDEFPALRREFEELEVQFNSGSSDFSIPEGMEAMDEVNSIVKKHGYTDFNDFILKISTIVSSYASIATSEEMKNAQPEIDKAISEIENNEYYTEEQKEQMKAAMMQTSEAIKGMSSMASPENIAVVKPYTDEIKKVLEEE